MFKRQGEAQAIPRQAFIWLLFSLWFTLLPLWQQLPWWLIVVGSVVTYWRYKIFSGAWNYPPRSVKVSIALLVALALLLTFRSESVGMQSMLSLLVAGFTLKLLELKHKSELYFLCFLGFFVAATPFLMSTSFITATYGVVNFSVIMATLIATNQSTESYRVQRTLRIVVTLLAQAIPVMMVLFLVVPRLGSLWTVPLNNTQAKTGVSNSMSPGDFSDLIRSGDPAFRVSFESDIPPSSQLYWRGLVLSDFDGRTWQQAKTESIAQPAKKGWKEAEEAKIDPRKRQVTWQGEATEYQVLLEPNQNNWLYALPAIKSFSNDLQISSTFTLFRSAPVSQRFQYNVTSHIDYLYHQDALTEAEYQQATLLPQNSNPMTKEVAGRWVEEAELQSSGKEELQLKLIQKILKLFNEKFHYTLKPPLLGDNTIDDFLWTTQTGFCEHFSSSFVYFMRSVGIPARVVVGYQGGEINPIENYLMVRQYDAHAWAEVWLPSRGWLRVDPTAAVAPERIEKGAEYSLSDAEYWLMGNGIARKIAWLGDLQLQWDAFNYRWQIWVMDYDSSAQQAFISRWFSGMQPWRIALIVMSIIGAFIVMIIGIMLWRQRPAKLSKQHRYYALFCRKLKKMGIALQEGEAPGDFSARASLMFPKSAESIRNIAELFEAVEYAESEMAIKELRLAVARFPKM